MSGEILPFVAMAPVIIHCAFCKEPIGPHDEAYDLPGDEDGTACSTECYDKYCQNKYGEPTHDSYEDVEALGDMIEDLSIHSNQERPAC